MRSLIALLALSACTVDLPEFTGDDTVIDAGVRGNNARFINHSCEPNAYMRSAPGDKVLFFALRDIQAGEEITMDYRDPYHPAAGECRCGSAKCRSLRRNGRE